ncbi:MAG: VWA domain-containing protein [Fibrobacterales bacterium]
MKEVFYNLHNPEYLWLLIIIPIMVWNYVRTQNSQKYTIRYSGIKKLKSMKSSLALKLRHMLIVIKCLAVMALIVALARPQSGEALEYINAEGIDIVLALDVSGSMGALDMLTTKEMAKIGRMDAEKFYNSSQHERYTRLGAAKNVIGEFVDKRKTDRLGLVIYAGRSYTQCPLTMDYGILKQFLSTVNNKSVSVDGTAIGNAIMSGTSRLKDSKAKSKVIILLTDGANNAGSITPLQASNVAQAMGIKIYTVGVGKKSGSMLVARQNQWTGEMSWGEAAIDKNQGADVGLLKAIAEKTDAKFFYANNKSELATIYDEIDALERTEIESHSYTKYQEEFYWFLIAGALLLLLEIVLANTRFIKIP